MLYDIILLYYIILSGCLRHGPLPRAEGGAPERGHHPGDLKYNILYHVLITTLPRAEWGAPERGHHPGDLNYNILYYVIITTLPRAEGGAPERGHHPGDYNWNQNVDISGHHKWIISGI